MSRHNHIYKDVTIISEGVMGLTGTENWEEMNMDEIKNRIEKLSERGWEVIEVQHGPAQETLEIEDW